MGIIVDSHRSYRKYSTHPFDIEPVYLINRETLPCRESVHDFDLDPPLTCQGLKEAFHTGK